MLPGYDHIIMAVADLPGSVDRLAGAGFQVLARPDAQATDTENRFVTFPGGSYLQIAAFRDPSKSSSHKWAATLREGDGWVDYALRVRDIEAVAGRLANSGIKLSPINTSTRPLTDGRDWSIRTLHAGRGAGSTPVLPYFVEDLTERAVRVPPPSANQPGDARDVVGATVLTSDLAAMTSALDAVYGSGASTPLRFGGSRAALLFRMENAWLEVIEPRNDAGILADHLRRRGEGVYEITLGEGAAGPAADAQVMTVCGARIAIATGARSDNAAKQENTR